MGDFNRHPLLRKGVKLHPDDTAFEAVTLIAQYLVRSIQQNEDGIIEDVDTEFLHQYRVSIRKLRSLLTLIEGVYPLEDSRRLKSAFGGYAKDTNDLRDLDVYLLDEAVHRARLDPSLNDGLDALFDDLRGERKRAIQGLKQLFLSNGYQNRKKADQEWFFLPDLPRGPTANKRIDKLVTKQIRNHYDEICRKGKSIGDKTPDRQVHKLRTECKKLRYLLELFSSLFSAKEINRVTRRLKGLQTTLGRFNDYCTQRQFLLGRLETSQNLPLNTAAAVGGLIVSLNRSKKDGVAKIKYRLAKFRDPKTTKKSLGELLT
jgi:CHAD domain-containing protein